MKVAVITPYYKEEASLIRRCIDSVRAQTVAADHFLVSDGFPQDWIDGACHRHLRLGVSHADYGNTPRGIGGQLAIAEQYDAIAFLDADNWYDPDHVEACLDTAKRETGKPIDCDFVIAFRRFVRKDGSVMNLTDEADHVDTNCLFLLPGAFHIVPYWNLMPREFSAAGDRAFNQLIRSRQLVGRTNAKPTVNYLTLWAAAYAYLGEVPPPDAKPTINGDPMFEWFKTLDPRRRKICQNLLGFDLNI